MSGKETEEPPQKKMRWEPKPSDVLTLDVMGEYTIKVRRHVLTQFEGKLASKFSGRFEDEVDADGKIFIDQHPEIFIPLLKFLVAKATETEHSMASAPLLEEFDDDEYLFRQFLHMLHYFGLFQAMYPVRVVPLTDSRGEVPMLFVPGGVSLPEPLVDEAGYTRFEYFFYLEATDPRLCVVSCRLEFGGGISGDSLVHIGWSDPSHFRTWCSPDRPRRLTFRFQDESLPYTIDCDRDAVKISRTTYHDQRNGNFRSSVPASHVLAFGGNRGKWRLTDVVLGQIEELPQADEDAVNGSNDQA